MPIIVQKFGGTSVGTGERLHKVADIIERTLAQHSVIAVVSAMSGGVKTEGTTTLLLQAGQRAEEGAAFDAPLASIEKNHLRATGEALSSRALRDEVESWLRGELSWLGNFLEAIRVIRELSPRSQDVLMAVGERFAAYLVAAVLGERGLPAALVDLTFAVPEEEQTVDPGFFQRLQEHLAAQCAPDGGRVPVVTGFFGMVPGGLLRAVGRGYTDFTAALISAGLSRDQVHELQVWKEVDGVYTADPRRVPAARVLASITPREASELTYFGSEVLHPFTMERVVAAEIPIRIKNAFNPDAPGTVITQRDPKSGTAMRATAVTAKGGITVVTITSNRMYNAYGFLAGVFNKLANYEVVVDLVSTSEVSVSFTIDRLDEIRRAKRQLEELGKVEITPGRAILAMVGEGMKFAKGTAGLMFSSLGASGINIEMISQGASEMNISCVIKEEDAENGLRTVHHAFLEEG